MELTLKEQCKSVVNSYLYDSNFNTKEFAKSIGEKLIHVNQCFASLVGEIVERYEVKEEVKKVTNYPELKPIGFVKKVKELTVGDWATMNRQQREPYLVTELKY